MRKTIFSTLLMSTVFASTHVFAACGDKITVANGSQIIVPPVITWDASIEESMQVAQIKKKPFAIYFSCKDDMKVVGESEEAIKDYLKANNNSVPATVTDVPRVIALARDIGVGTFVKIPITKETRELAEKFAGETNLLVICAPNGDRITSIKCTHDAAQGMEAAKKQLATWQGGNLK